jgi:hypothetical protein
MTLGAENVLHFPTAVIRWLRMLSSYLLRLEPQRTVDMS